MFFCYFKHIQSFFSWSHIICLELNQLYSSISSIFQLKILFNYFFHNLFDIFKDKEGECNTLHPRFIKMKERNSRVFFCCVVAITFICLKLIVKIQNIFSFVQEHLFCFREFFKYKISLWFSYFPWMLRFIFFLLFENFKRKKNCKFIDDYH